MRHSSGFSSCLPLRYPDRELKRAYVALQVGDAGMRAIAVELLDNVLERDLKELILPLLEGPVERVLALAQSRFGIASESFEARLKEPTASSLRRASKDIKRRLTRFSSVA